MIVGEPESDRETGILETTDPADPNYFDIYYIDYYTLDLTGVPENTVILIQLLESEFSPYIATYDPNDFTKEDGGPEIN